MQTVPASVYIANLISLTVLGAAHLVKPACIQPYDNLPDLQPNFALKVARVVKGVCTCTCRYFEKFYFNPGDTGFKVFKTKYATIGVAICWDQWFPEAARAMALQGAEVWHDFPPLQFSSIPCS